MYDGSCPWGRGHGVIDDQFGQDSDALQSRHGTSQFSTAQHSTAFGTVHRSINSALQLGASRGESSWHFARRVPWRVPWH
eukprot:4251124-Pyramimonas_sp.AAC.1